MLKYYMKIVDFYTYFPKNQFTILGICVTILISKEEAIMGNKNSTAHGGVGEEEALAEDLDSEFDIVEFLDDDSVASHTILKYKNKVIELLADKLVGAGSSESDARIEAEDIVASRIKEKQEEERYHHGEFDFDFMKIYSDDGFLGGVSLEVSKIPDSTMPTAYVSYRPNGKTYEVVMGFNPKFFRSLNPEQRQGVIRHEMYHLVFQHIFERAVGDKSYQLLYNWATDLAINSIIGKERLPDACLIPGHHPLDPKTGKPLPGPYAAFIAEAETMKSSDFYFEKLREIQQEHGDSDLEIAIGSGLGTFDDHDRWQSIPKHVREALKDKVRGIMEKSCRNAERSNSWGSVPLEIQEIIRRMLSREIDWRSVLHGFVGRCRTMERISTVRRINKKVPYAFPGVKRKYVAKFVVFIDQSGSMMDTDIALLFSELEVASQYADLDVYHFDTEVDEPSHTLWTKGSGPPEKLRTRAGGTDFQCVADFCNRSENRGRWAGVFILTDGYAPTMGQLHGARTLWVITEHGTMEHVRPGDLAVKMKEARTFSKY
jgi:predicted metal-dependent peptidase